MEVVLNYVKPELIVVAIALYFLGIALKNTEKVKDKMIPFILGAVGIVLAFIYVFATSAVSTYQDVLFAIFTSIVQGMLVAALSTYVNQLLKQSKKAS